MTITASSIPPVKQAVELVEYAKKTDEQTKEMIKLTKWIRILTFVMVGLVIAQIVLTILRR